jgi:hypothetical protein
MATKVLGTVALIPKGVWASGTYNKNEYVYHTTLNASYVALHDGVTSEPSGYIDTVDWHILCRGIGVTTDNNFTDAYKTKVDAAVLNTQVNVANGFVGIDSDGKINNTEYLQVKNRIVNVKEYGAIGDGNSHPLSSKYSTLALAQVDYPFAVALTDEIDWCAIQKALNNAYGVHVPAGEYITNYPLRMSRCQKLYGVGGSYPVINGTTQARKAYGSVIRKTTTTGFAGLSSYKRDGTVSDLSSINSIIIICNSVWDYNCTGISINDICLVSDYNISSESRATGIYMHIAYSCNFSNIIMYGIYRGIDGYDYFKNKLSNCNAFDAVDCGFIQRSTSNDLSNCYVTGARVGFYVTGAYQHLDNCAADQISNIAYWVANAEAVKLSGCGQEMCIGNKLRVDNSDSVTIDTCFASGNTTLKDSILPNYSTTGITNTLTLAERQYTIVVKTSNVKFINTLFRIDATMQDATKTRINFF